MQRKIFGFVFTCAMLAQMAVASAQDRTWGGTGSWSDSARWTPGDVPDTATENAIFSFSNLGTATVDQSFTIGNLTFGFNNTISIGGGNTLTVNNFENTTVGTITGAGNLVVAGTGAHNWRTILMTGTGSTTFSAGDLTIANLQNPSQVTSRTINTNGNTFWTDGGQALTISSAIWNNGGTFVRNQTGGSSRSLDLNGTSTFNNSITGTFRQSGSVAAVVTGGNFNNAGIVESAASSLTFNASVNLTNSGTMRTAGGTLALNGPITNSGSIIAENGAITISGTFTNNAGGVLDARGSTITVNAAMTHNGGRLLVDGGTIAGTAPLTFNTSGGIEGVGTITQSVTMNAGTYIAPGMSPGLLTFNNNLTVNSGELRIQIGGTNFGVDTDLINVLGTASLENVTVDASLINAFEPASIGQQFLFFTAGNDLEANVATWALSPSSTAFSGFALSGDNRSVFLVSAVPEPSSFALLGLCTGMGLFARKRRAVASI